MTTPLDSLIWEPGALRLVLLRSEDAPVSAQWAIRGSELSSVMPIADVNVLGRGRCANQKRGLDNSEVGLALRYVSHDIHVAPESEELVVTQRDDSTGIEIASHFRYESAAVGLHAWSVVINTGASEVIIESLTSMRIGLMACENPSSLSLMRGTSSWCAENRWEQVELARTLGLISNDSARYPAVSSSCIRSAGSSTWTTDGDLPLGIVVDAASGLALMWQIEASGLPWTWELGLDGVRPFSCGLSLAGPNRDLHDWCAALATGEEITSACVDIAMSASGWQGAVAEMTHLRRALRSGLGAECVPSVIFNDYMNTLNGDPTTDRLLPLIEAAASVGVEIFCIDAGWYDDTGDWWDSVGEWKPSTTRFAEGGIEALLRRIRALGMTPGLWVEPESVGVKSPQARTFSDNAFLTRNGHRVIENGRLLLDFRSSDVREHLDETFDRLVAMGTGMFKLDYNVTPGVGSDFEAPSPGAGLAAHVAAYRSWFERLRARHPHVIFENCASGAMRQDFGHLRAFDLQSTSDQQTAELYVPIAVGAPMTVLPEMCGNWAYPQPEMSDSEIVFTMATGLSGRLYQAGRLDLLSDRQLDLVRQGIVDFVQNRGWLLSAVPWWPLGLPLWDDPVLAYGMRAESRARLLIWNRRPGSRKVKIPLGALDTLTPTVIYEAAHIALDTTRDGRALECTLPSGPSAHLIELR